VTGVCAALAGVALSPFAVSFAWGVDRAPSQIDATSSTESRVGPSATVGAGLGEATGVGAAAGVHEGLGVYEGRWSDLSSRSDSGGGSAFLNSAGSASLTFTGDSVRWLSRTTPSAGIADVHIDGELVASVDRYSATSEYQRTVFSRDGLGAGEHTITVSWSGRKNPASSDRNLVVDAIVVPDTGAPAVPASVGARRADGAVDIDWAEVADWSPVSYRVYRALPGEGPTLIGKTSPGTTSFRDLGAPARATATYSVTALDGWGNESAPSAGSRLDTGTTRSALRYAACPTASATVSTVAQFKKAVQAAVPGSVIRLAPGRYAGQLDITARGTAAQPVWICGSRDVVVDGGGLSVKSPINMAFSSHVVVTGMTATNALKGVTVRGSDHITISDLLVEDIGYEGIHLRSHTADSTVVGNTVRRTGRLDPFYGEGVYIGSSKNNWCALTDCEPDRSDRNAVLDNSISETGSDLIEAKEGTTAGLIAGNRLDGTGGMSRTESWVKVAGNDWTVVRNSGVQSSMHGFQVNGDSPGWGLRTLLSDNDGRVDAAGYGFKLWEPDGGGTSDTLLVCGNRISGAAAGFASVACTR